MKSALIILATEIESGALPQGDTDDQVQAILTFIFGLSGAIALLVIVVSGFRYILSAGEPERINKAKNGVIYALIGLILVITAQAIVAFVGGRL